MGAIFNVKVIPSTNEKFFEWKKKNQISSIGTSLSNAINYTKADWKLPFVLLMGNEQSGLSDKVLNQCDQLIKMPMLGKSDSLNLAVSAGIALYESIRKNPK